MTELSSASGGTGRLPQHPTFRRQSSESNRSRNTVNTYLSQDTVETNRTGLGADLNRRPKNKNRISRVSKPILWRGTLDGNRHKPRCLYIDYCYHPDPSGTLQKKVAHTEINGDLEKLRKVLDDPRPANCSLRVLHIQNWNDANRYVGKKYRMNNSGPGAELADKFGFHEWVSGRKPRKRGGKHFLQAETFNGQDHARLVSRCAIGMDYLKSYRVNNPDHYDRENPMRVTYLNGYNSQDEPTHTCNVYAQRAAMYIQQYQPEMGGSEPSLVPHEHTDGFDNGNTIVIMDNSATGSIDDTLFPARGYIEGRWRRLPYVVSGFHDSEKELSIKHHVDDAMIAITEHFFSAISNLWQKLLDDAWDHVSILEDKIYDDPSDETRAPELWKNAARWLIFEKLMYYHVDCVDEMKNHLAELDGDFSDTHTWLPRTQSQFNKVSKLLDDDLTKRTNNLSDLMYKSVSVRDSREGLRLNGSMWRLSWITFIFLPANCLLAAYGMNVKELNDTPSVWWVCVAAVPFFAVVIGCWYILKYWFAQSRNYSEESRAGIFEGLVADLGEKRPELFDNNGPKDWVVTADRVSRWKWELILYWARRDRARQEAAAARKGVGIPSEPIGLWSRAKRAVILRWAPTIQVAGQSRSGKKKQQVSYYSNDDDGSTKVDVEFVGGGEFIAKGLRPTLEPALAVGITSGVQVATDFKGWGDDKNATGEAGPSKERPMMPETTISGMMVEEGSDESQLKQMIVSEHGNITQESPETDCAEDADREVL